MLNLLEIGRLTLHYIYDESYMRYINVTSKTSRGYFVSYIDSKEIWIHLLYLVNQIRSIRVQCQVMVCWFCETTWKDFTATQIRARHNVKQEIRSQINLLLSSLIHDGQQTNKSHWTINLQKESTWGTLYNPDTRILCTQMHLQSAVS